VGARHHRRRHGARLGGLSRSAVLGKVFRLRLREVTVAGDGVRDAEANKPARRRRAQPRSKPAPPQVVTTQHKSLLELTNITCRWVVEATVKWAVTAVWSHFQ